MVAPAVQTMNEDSEINWMVDPDARWFDVPAKNLREFDEFQETIFRQRRTNIVPVFRVPPAIASLLKGRSCIFGKYAIEAKRF